MGFSEVERQNMYYAAVNVAIKRSAGDPLVGRKFILKEFIVLH